MQVWTRTQPDEVIKVGWRTLVRKTFERPDGKPAEFVTKEPIGARDIATIAITKEGKVVVAEQFRQGPESIFEDLPGGGAEPGENLQDAAMRELLEETGYTSTDIEELGVVYKDAYTNASSHYYLAKNCELTHPQELDEGEFINVKLITIGQLFDNAGNGKMTDTAAVFLAYDQLKQIQQEGE